MTNPMDAEEAVERLEMLTTAIGMDPMTRAALTLAIDRLGEPSREELLAAAKVLVTRYDFWMPEFQRLRAAILLVEGGVR